MLGVGDVDFMDYNISYYTVGSLGERMWVRGLYAYPAIPGRATISAPDLAAGRRGCITVARLTRSRYVLARGGTPRRSAR